MLCQVRELLCWSEFIQMTSKLLDINQANQNIYIPFTTEPGLFIVFLFPLPPLLIPQPLPLPLPIPYPTPTPPNPFASTFFNFFYIFNVEFYNFPLKNLEYTKYPQCWKISYYHFYSYRFLAFSEINHLSGTFYKYSAIFVRD